MTALDTVLEKQTAEPIELPRLTTAKTFNTFNRLGVNLDAAREAYKKIPEAATESDVQHHLGDLVRYCEGAISQAKRLMEANK